MYPTVPAVFVDTGLEYPEIREFVKTIDNVTWLKPKKTFKKIIEDHGYPVISKEIALKVRQMQTLPHDGITYNLRITGVDSKGKWHTMGALPKKWGYLENAPFKISEHCCYVMKKGPSKVFEGKTGLKPYLGMMASDSSMRARMYLKKGCNAFEGNTQSNPMSFWLEQDVWDYIKIKKLPYSSIYNMGYQRTGCAFCMFGAHLEKPNKFQLMKNTHPKLYKYCMEKLKLDEVLTYCNVDH